MAECISTVRVVKIVGRGRRIYGFWSVSRRKVENAAANFADRPQRANCDWWRIREATYLSDEVLDRLQCDDTWFEDH